MDLIDVTYLLFGQAMPLLDLEDRSDIVELINVGDPDVALHYLIAAIDRGAIPVDAALLDLGRALDPVPARIAR